MEVTKDVLLFNKCFGYCLKRIISFGDMIYTKVDGGYSLHSLDYNLISKDIYTECEFDEQSGLFPSIQNVLDVMKDNGMVLNCIKQMDNLFFVDIHKGTLYSDVQFDENMITALLKAVNMVVINEKNC